MASVFDQPSFDERLFFPRDDTSPAPAGAVDVRVPVDGAELHLRWHRGGAPLTVLLFHGNGEVVADYDGLAPLYADRGASLAVVDYRGYGASTGTPTLRDALRDAPLVLEALRAAGADRVVVMGRSLGSASCAEIYGGPDRGVLGFVWESGFVDLAALVARRGLEPPAAFTDAELATFDPQRKLARGRRPLLLLHGEEDSLIRVHEARAAHAAAGTAAADKELVIVPGHGHNDLSYDALYWDALGRFFARLR